LASSRSARIPIFKTTFIDPSHRYIRGSTDGGISTALFSVTGKSNGSEKSNSFVRTLVDHGEELVYVIVAGLLLVAAVVACGFAAFSAAQQFVSDKPLEGIFSCVNDLLLVLIIMEVLWTVTGFIGKRELDIGVEDVVPFLVIGAISAARRILAIGAKLSLGEAQQSEQAGGTFAGRGSWDRFNQGNDRIRR
jgi:uncharacterized membrane protein (DUF373 family)